MTEKFYLQWNDFPMNTADSFAKLRNNEAFKDVTLISDDQQHLTAHKVVLASCSSYFSNVLSNNPHSHPLLCLDGIGYEELKCAIDYIYFGEVKIDQNKLQGFMKAGRKLQLNGLMPTDDSVHEEQVTSEESVIDEYELKEEKPFVKNEVIDKKSSEKMI